MTYEGLRLMFLKEYRLRFAKTRRSKIRNTDFTIISNNCWGGMLYESYDLPKLSPTVGLFFMADEYIKFLGDIKAYTSKELTFISPDNSRYAEVLRKDTRFGSYPIGVIDDVEIAFLHYHSESEAKEKWERRCGRINWEKLIVKFNDQNGCREEHVRAFSEMPFKNKLFFTIHDWPVTKWDGYCVIKQYTHDDCITASHEPFWKNRYVDLTAIINDA